MFYNKLLKLSPNGFTFFKSILLILFIAKNILWNLNVIQSKENILTISSKYFYIFVGYRVISCLGKIDFLNNLEEFTVEKSFILKLLY